MNRFLRGVAVVFSVVVLPVQAARAQSGDEVPTYTIEQFMNTTSYFGASFAPDETSILVSSNVTGVVNAYEIPIEGGTPRALTSSETNAVFAIGFFPRDRRILYSSDRGGDENTHLYVLDPDGSVTDVTPGDSVRAEFQGWSDDRTSFYYGFNARDRRYMDLFEVDLETLESSLVFENVEGWQVGPLSPDRRWLALVRPRTTNDSDLFLRDNRTGEIEHLTRHEGDATFSPVGFSRDSRSLDFVTNRESEFSYLVRRTIESGDEAVLDQPEWDVSFASRSRSGRYYVIGTNNDARTEVRVFEQETWKPVVLPEVADGDIAGVGLSPSDRHMVFFMNGDRSPSNLLVVDLETDGVGVRQLTNSMNPEIDPAHLVDASVVRYPSYDGVEIPALQYIPHEASADNPVPVILWIHGGPGGQSRLGYSATRQFMVNHGYAVLAVNNRGSSGYGKAFFAMDDQRHGEADLDDVVWAKEYLATQPWADTDKVVILGGSYGGYMTLAGVTFRPEAFAAGVDLYGISNWVRTLENIPPWWAAMREALYAEMGDPATDQERLHSISPLFHADQIVRPLMVLQGANDPRVLQHESDVIVDAVRERGGTVEYVLFPDEGHGFRKRANQITAWGRILAFLDQHVKGTRPSAQQ